MIFEVKNYAAMQDAISQFCRFLVSENVSSESVFDSRLVANELVSNVLRHSDGEAKLHGEVKDAFVELVIVSTKKFVPPETPRCSDVYAEHGRGLYLVDAVCAERSVTSEGGIRVRIKIR